MVAHAFWGQLLCARPGTETHAWIRTHSKLRRGSHHPSLQVKKLTGEVEVHASPHPHHRAEGAGPGSLLPCSAGPL